MQNRQRPIGVDNPGAPPAGFEDFDFGEGEKPGEAEARAKKRAEAMAAGERGQDSSLPLGVPGPHWRHEINAAQIRPLEWVVDDLALRRKVSVLIGPGGVAKSTLGIQVGLGAATGRSDIAGLNVPSRRRTWIWNQEDDEEDITRRVAAVMKHFGINNDQLLQNGQSMIAWNTGVNAPLVIAQPIQGTPRVNREVLEAMRETILRERIELLILDPFAELHTLNELDNGQMRMVTAAIRDLAEATGCAILLIAHTRKMERGDSQTYLGDLEGLRGASSQGGVVRAGATLYTPPAKDEKVWQFDHPRAEYARLDFAKNNFGRKRIKPAWYHRIGVKIANGEYVGVLQPVNLQPRIREGRDLLGPLVDAVKRLGPGYHQWITVRRAIAVEDRPEFDAMGTNAARDIGDKLMLGRDRMTVDDGMLMRTKMGNRWAFKFEPGEPMSSSHPANDDLPKMAAAQ
jgi:hypothetical protein